MSTKVVITAPNGRTSKVTQARAKDLEKKGWKVVAPVTDNSKSSKENIRYNTPGASYVDNGKNNGFVKMTTPNGRVASVNARSVDKYFDQGYTLHETSQSINQALQADYHKANDLANQAIANNTYNPNADYKQLAQLLSSAGNANTSKATNTSNATNSNLQGGNNSFAYDTNGNKVNVIIKDGITYLTNGQRLPTGYTVETAGGIYKMGSDGKGVKVNSHNKPVNSQPNLVSDDNYLNDMLTALMNQNKELSNEMYNINNQQYQQGNNPSGIDKDILNLIQSLPQEILNNEEAMKLATEQLGYQYDKALADTLSSIDNQALQSGFFGQLPTVDYKERYGDDIERARASGISQLANQLEGQSKNDINNTIAQLLQYSNLQADKDIQAWQQAFQERQYQDSRGDIDWEKLFKTREYQDNRGDVDWEKLFKERQYSDSRSDIDWEKGVTEAQITGIFQGQPTMALTQLSHNMGMDNKQMEMAETELNHSIQMSYENLKNDRTALGQAGARIGLQSASQAMDEKKFMANLKETAFGMTMDELNRTGQATFDEELGWFTSSNITTGDIVDTMDMYTKILLGDINADDIYNLNASGLYGGSTGGVRNFTE